MKDSMTPEELGAWLDELLRGEPVSPADPALAELVERLANAPRPEAPNRLLERIGEQVERSGAAQEMNTTSHVARFIGGGTLLMAIVGVAALLFMMSGPRAISPLIDATPATDTAQPISSATARPTATPSHTATASPTPSPMITASPTPSATIAASATPFASPSDTPTPSATATESPTTTVLAAFINATDLVNMRAGPGLHHNVITMLPPGTPIVIIGTNEIGDWQQIQIDSGQQGWVATALISWVAPVTADGASPPSQSSSAAGLEMGMGEANGQRPTNPGDFGCLHSGNYCNAPGQGNGNGDNGGKGKGK